MLPTCPLRPLSSPATLLWEARPSRSLFTRRMPSEARWAAWQTGRSPARNPNCSTVLLHPGGKHSCTRILPDNTDYSLDSFNPPSNTAPYLHAVSPPHPCRSPFLPSLPSLRCYLQKRVLNRSRGPAVWALRAQTDKREYSMEMRKVVER